MTDPCGTPGTNPHWWMVPPAASEMLSVCKHCGAEMTFAPQDLSAYNNPTIPHAQGSLGLSRAYGRYGSRERGWQN